VRDQVGRNSFEPFAVPAPSGLEGFKRREYKVLVATDLAARGIDVDGISHVVNYDTPVFSEDYIHRIGRTGRAEATGIAFTFVSNDEEKYFKRIEYLTNKRFELKEYPGLLTRRKQEHKRGKTSRAFFKGKKPISANRGSRNKKRTRISLSFELLTPDEFFPRWNKPWVFDLPAYHYFAKLYQPRL